MSPEKFNYLLGMAGTVAFAVTAVCAVTPKRIDLFGACVMGLITAIGGGTIRDLILSVPVFWANDLNYIWVALGSSILTFVANRLMTRGVIYRAMLYLDAIGVAMFAIQAAHKSEYLAFALPLGPILLGLTTAIGGGLLRDMLAGNPTLLMKQELYAIPVTAGLILYMTLLHFFPERAILLGSGCTLLTFVFRAAAIRWNLTIPEFLITHSKQN